jgi:hypothetical protein
MSIKICRICCIEKDFSKFSKRTFKSGNVGYRTECKNCLAIRHSDYHIANKKAHNQRDKFYYSDNKEKILKKRDEYYQENVSDIILYKKKYRRLNKDKCRKSKNRVRVKRRLKDPAFKLREMVSRNICRGLLKTGSNKNGKSCLKYLPYSMEELKYHIEKQFAQWMNWKNHGVYNIQTWNDNDQFTWTWQLDHIIPQCKLLYSSMEDENFKKCWALENLRPLSAKQNILDGKRDKRLFSKIKEK